MFESTLNMLKGNDSGKQSAIFDRKQQNFYNNEESLSGSDSSIDEEQLTKKNTGKVSHFGRQQEKNKQGNPVPKPKDDRQIGIRVVDDILSLENKSIEVKDIENFRKILSYTDNNVHNIIWFKPPNGDHLISSYVKAS